MQVTYIGLSEYFDRCLPKARKQGYFLVVSLIARYGDGHEVYDKLEKNWASLNDLTNEKILFVLSTPQISKRASFFHLPGKEIYEGVMCPFVEMLNGEDLEDNNGPFKYMYRDYRKIDWKQKHSQTITEFALNYKIHEEQIPCLFVYDLENERYKAISISQNTDVYSMIKYLIIEMSEYIKTCKKVKEELQKYQNIDKYFHLYNVLETQAKKEDSSENIAIIKVLNGEQSYKSVKEDVLNPKIRTELKKIGQWKRHYIDALNKNDLEKQQYYTLKKRQQDLEKEWEIIWNNIENTIQKENKKNKVDYEEKIIQDLLEACVKLQANSTYYNVIENKRNDYIRDLLSTAGYDVKDQTRRGASFSGKDAGEVDILVEKEGRPISIIEALNLKGLNTSRLDEHIAKLFGYDTAGNKFNIILSYVKVNDFESFCQKYCEYLKTYQYEYSLIAIQEKYLIEEFPYSDIQVMKTMHNRNGCKTVLYHICVWMKNG